MQIQCIIVLSKNEYLANNLSFISLNRTQYLHFPQNFGKIVTTVLPLKLYSKKYINITFQSKYFVYKILRDFMQQNPRKNQQEFLKNGIAMIPTHLSTQFASLLFILINILHTIFVQFNSLETDISASQKFRKKQNYSATY